MKKVTILIALITVAAISSCKKSQFLDIKPSSNIVEPQSAGDFEELLDNTTVMNYTGGLAQLASDDYETTYANWQTVSNTERNSYTWAVDIYQGDVGILDWNSLYQEVFYANVVLDGTQSMAESPARDYIRGWALFDRAYAFYDLTRNFCKSYDKSTANSDLGIPLRLSPDIDYLVKRSTLQQSYNQIFADLTTALPLLPAIRPSANLNRPSQIAAYALLARIYLSMRDYASAETNADKALALYSTLIDYNTVSQTSSTPFSKTNDELIYNSSQVVAYSDFTGSSFALSTISQSVISLYDNNDLRLATYFKKSGTTYTKKRGYYGTGLYPFTGLATDELYLIKAECLARDGNTDEAMTWLNNLLIKRFRSGTFVPLTAANSTEALSLILTERRKELIWRGLRWHDLKRLNLEGANITLSRSLNGVNYTIPPNDPRYVFPIPSDEIALSGIQQNAR
ncbi:MAG: RagB/SusD family nutrient uptake outer membrane protein [Bacteroidetes bacterium]|nr:RagB/SusD family nutrient uptake outer membrane protein [Bacteroidota bacterium]